MNFILISIIVCCVLIAFLCFFLREFVIIGHKDEYLPRIFYGLVLLGFIPFINILVTILLYGFAIDCFINTDMCIRTDNPIINWLFTTKK